MQKLLRKALLGLAIICLSVGLIIPAQLVSAAPQSFTDISSKHWAIGPINQWNNLGLVGGYAGNTFRPNQPITKAEFIAFVNRGFGFTKQAQISFADVKLGSWFYADIAKAVGRGYAVVGDNAAFQPNKPLSRLEAAQMLHTVLRLVPVAENALARFTDVGNLTDAERAMVNSIVAGGYLSGYTNNTLRLNSTITRAEMIAILSRGAGEIMNVATTYGPETGTRTLNGNATISKSGTTLRNTVVKGDLYITEGVGNGDVYLMDVVVEGRTIVAGGGSNSVHAGGQTRLAQVKITYPDGTTRLVVEGEASAGEVEFQTPGIVDNSQSTSDIRPNIVINVPPGATVEIIGDVNDVTVASAETNLQMGEGSTASNVTATESAQGSTLNIQGNVTGTLANNAPNATTTVAPTATVANVTTSESATGSTTNVQGKVTGALTVNAPNATAEVTGTVNQMTTGTSATGSNVSVTGTVTTLALNAPQANTTITGTVTTVQANASGQLNLSAGANVGTLEVAPGTTGVAVDREQGSTVGTIVVPPDTTIDLDGKDQTGPISGGGTGGGTGGGDTLTPTISTVNLLGPTGNTVHTATINGLTGTIDLTGLLDTAQVKTVVISTSPSNYTVALETAAARGFTTSISGAAGTAPYNLSTNNLTGNWASLLGLLTPGGYNFDDDLSMGTLRAITGGSIQLTGKVNGTSNMSLTLNMGTTTKAVPTPWGDVKMVGNTITITVTRLGTKLDDHYGELLLAFGLVLNVDNQWPQYVSFDGGADRAYPGGVNDLKTDIDTGIAGKTWSELTLGDLRGHSLTFTLPNGTSYTVSFQAAP